MTPRSGLHATAVIYGECGVVILGASGAGKSSLALALISQARLLGRFGALVGDDRVWVEAVNGRLLLSGAPHVAGLIERRGLGLTSVPSETVAVAGLFVELSGPDRHWPRWPDQSDTIVIEGVCLPRLKFNPAAALDNAISVDEVLTQIGANSDQRRGISLEQSAAVHKNVG